MAMGTHVHDMANGMCFGKTHLGEVLGAAQSRLFDKYSDFTTDLCSEMALCGALSRGP